MNTDTALDLIEAVEYVLRLRGEGHPVSAIATAAGFSDTSDVYALFRFLQSVGIAVPGRKTGPKPYCAPAAIKEWESLVQGVCGKHGVSPKQVMSANRSHHLVRARHELWFRARHEAGFSLPEVGRLSRRDHTTVLAGVRRHESRIAVQHVAAE